jgi:hypothetical protein
MHSLRYLSQHFLSPFFSPSMACRPHSTISRNESHTNTPIHQFHDIDPLSNSSIADAFPLATGLEVQLVVADGWVPTVVVGEGGDEGDRRAGISGDGRRGDEGEEEWEERGGEGALEMHAGGLNDTIDSWCKAMWAE